MPSPSTLTIALTDPMTVPGAWLVVSAVPTGPLMATRAVGSSSGLTVALRTTPVAVCVTSSLGDEYAAMAEGTMTTAASAVSPTTTVPIRPLIRPSLSLRDGRPQGRELEDRGADARAGAL